MRRADGPQARPRGASARGASPEGAYCSYPACECSEHGWATELRADERSEEVLSDHPKGRMASVPSLEGACGAPKAGNIHASEASMDASAASIMVSRAQG